MNRFLLAASGLAFCAAEAGCERYDEDGIYVRTGCEEQRVARLRPEDGASNAYVDGWVVGEVECTAPESTIELRTQANRVVDAVITRHLAERQLRVRPNEPLAPNSTYVARMETDDGHREWSFVTTRTGTAVGGELLGITAAADSTGGLLLEPAGVATTLFEEIATMRPALELLSDAASGELTARLGAWTGAVETGTQDGSRATTELTLSWQDPFFESQPTDLRWRLVNFALVLEDAVVGGAVQPGAEGLEGFWLQGTWDTREAAASLGDVCTADLEGDGVGCGPCRDGAEDCLPFHLVHVPQVAWPGTLVEVQ